MTPESWAPAESLGAEPSPNSDNFHSVSVFSNANERSTLRPPQRESQFTPRDHRVASVNRRLARVGGEVSASPSPVFVRKGISRIWVMRGSIPLRGIFSSPARMPVPERAVPRSASCCSCGVVMPIAGVSRGSVRLMRALTPSSPIQ